MYDKLTGDNFPKTAKDADALVTSVYYQFRNGAWGRYNSDNYSMLVLGLLGTDEFTCQWGGFWGSPLNFTWMPGDFPFDDMYYQMTPAITIATSALYQLGQFTDILPADKLKHYMAEIKVCRAIMMFDMYKLYGPLPFIIDENDIPIINQIGYRPRPSKEDMVKAIEADLTDEIINTLEIKCEESDYGRMTRGIAHMCRLKLYLHEKDWEKVEAEARAIKALNVYSLQEDYKKIWSIDNERNSEIIWALVCQPTPEGVENNLRAHILPSDWASPNGYPVEGWNGYKVPWPFYNRFDPEDKRLECLIRYYKNKNGDIVDAKENCYGALPLKYSEDPAGTGMCQGVDYVLYRYADVLLALAEALNEINGPVQEAVDLINEVRTRAFGDDKPEKLAKLEDFSSKEQLRDYILDERGFELYFEGNRREDLIRHGKYIEYANDPDRMGEPGYGRPVNPQQNARPHHVLYPIPNGAIVESGGVIKQNEGYN